MDMHCAAVANRLLDNDSTSAVVELLLDGARFEVIEPLWVALCGAACEASIPLWRACRLNAGEILHVRHCASGLWSYLAVEGGFSAPHFFGSASYYARGRIGMPISSGLVLERKAFSKFSLPAGVSGRIAPWSERRDFQHPPPIRVWPGPQWNDFPAADRESFLKAEWKVSASSDRVGYRLEGPVLRADPPEIVSEPVLEGSIQVPQNGQPILTMRDGPTIGGYPKIALVDPPDLCRAAQVRPGRTLRFELIA